MDFGRSSACSSALTVLAGTLVALPGCGDGSDETPLPTWIPDNVEVVESDHPRWAEGEGWRLGDGPLVEIGKTEGEEAYLFAGLVRSPMILPDGRIAVGDRSGTYSEIRFFDPEGRFLDKVGRRGEGPGEFNYIVNTWLSPDGSAFLATDAIGGKINVWEVSGELREVVQSPPHPESQRVGAANGQFTDGTFFGAVNAGSALPEQRHGATYRDSVRYAAWSGDGTRFVDLVTVPTRPFWIRMVGGELAGISAVPFTVSAMSAAGAGAAYVGNADDPVVVQLDPEARVRRVLRWNATPRPLTDDDREGAARSRADGIEDEDEAREMEQVVRGLPYPENLPYFQTMRVDVTGHLWVERYRLARDEGPRRWDVFDPEGRWLGPVEVPVELRLEWIGEDRVLARTEDDLGVTRVVMYALDRS